MEDRIVPAMKFLIVNLITLSRIGAAIGMAIHQSELPIFTSFFLLGLITDGVDGSLARWWHVTSKLGKILDNVADGVFLLTAAVCIYFMGFIPLYLVIAYVLGCMILVATTHEQVGQRWLSVNIWARIGLGWFWFAVVLDGTIITCLIWMSYSVAIATALTVASAIILYITLSNPIEWRDEYIVALEEYQARRLENG